MMLKNRKRWVFWRSKKSNDPLYESIELHYVHHFKPQWHVRLWKRNWIDFVGPGIEFYTGVGTGVTKFAAFREALKQLKRL